MRTDILYVTSPLAPVFLPVYSRYWAALFIVTVTRLNDIWGNLNSVLV